MNKPNYNLLKNSAIVFVKIRVNVSFFSWDRANIISGGTFDQSNHMKTTSWYKLVIDAYQITLKQRKHYYFSSLFASQINKRI